MWSWRSGGPNAACTGAGVESAYSRGVLVLLDASLAVLHNGCAFQTMRSTFTARIGAATNSKPNLSIEPALLATLKAVAEAEHRYLAKQKGIRWTAERSWVLLLLRRSLQR